MKVLVVSLAAAVVLTACSTTKKVNKSSVDDSVKTSIDSASQSQKETKTESKNLTTVTSEIDTTLLIPGSTIKGDHPLKELLTQPWILSDLNQSITVSVHNNKINVVATKKDQQIPVKMKKQSVSETDIVTTEKSSDKKTASIDQDKKTKTKTTDKDVKRSFALPWWLWVLIILAIAVAVYVIQARIRK